MKLRDRVALNIQDLRRERGLSQEELALRADVNRGYMGKLENAKYAASLDMLEKSPVLSTWTHRPSWHLDHKLHYASLYLMLRQYIIVCIFSLVTQGPQHASSTQEAPPLGRSRFDCDKYVAAGDNPRADIPNRLRNPLVSFRRLACFSSLRPSPRRIHPTHYALAGGTPASNLALSYGRVL